MSSEGADDQGMTGVSGTASEQGQTPHATAPHDPIPDATSRDTETAGGIGDEQGLRELSVGARAGEYVIARVLAGGAAPRYLARKAPVGVASTAAGEPAGEAVELIAGDAGAFDDARVIASRALRHAHLLAPRAAFAWGGRDYLALDACDAPDEAVAPLDATAALAAGVDLADALVYLHRSGVVHQRVSPDAVALCGGTAYLTGLQHAQTIHPADPDAVVLFARDANFLARTLGALAQGAHASANGPDASDPGAVALAAIVERAEANGYHSPAEVGLACAEALPTGAANAPRAGTATVPISTAVPDLLNIADNAPAPPRAGEAPQPTPTPATSTGGVPAATEQLRFVVGVAMSVGRVRDENQDAAATMLFEIRDDVHAGIVGSMPAGLFLVADGMGGEERGDLASRIASRTMVAEVARRLLIPVTEGPVQAARAALNDPQVMLPNLEEVLVESGRAANAEVRKLAKLLGKVTGSTLTAIAAIGARAAFVHIGDSRAHLLRAGQMTQLTEDHTLLARLEKMQHPLLQEPGFIVPRSYLYRSLGQDDQIDLDAGSLTLAPGDRLLLCSDGLWDEVDAGRIAGVLASAATPQDCADALVRTANDHGGNDNSSVVVVFVGQQGAIN